MPIDLSINSQNDKNDSEARRSLTNFFENVNQNKLNLPDPEKSKLGELRDNYNKMYISLHEFKTELNDLYNRLAVSK